MLHCIIKTAIDCLLSPVLLTHQNGMSRVTIQTEAGNFSCSFPSVMGFATLNIVKIGVTMLWSAVFSELSKFGKTAVSHDPSKAIMYENGSTEVVPVATMARDEI